MKFPVRFYIKGRQIYRNKVVIEADSIENARQVLQFMLESNDPSLPEDNFDQCEI